MAILHNPAFRQEPRDKQPDVIPMSSEGSIIEWLERKGRLVSRDLVEHDYPKELIEEDVVEAMEPTDTYSFEEDHEEDLDFED